MPGLSQTVLIDTTKTQTVLDKKATVATGNLLREGEGYKNLFNASQMLVDSLRFEITLHKKEASNLRLANTELTTLNQEKDNENSFLTEKMNLTKEKYEGILQSKKGNWIKGFLTGSGIAAVIFTLLSLTGG